MRTYRNEIDRKILKTIYTPEELEEMKEFTKKWRMMKYEKYEREMKIKKDLEGYVIGKLEGVEMNYMGLDGIFYISYTSDETHNKSIFKRLKEFLWK